MDKWEIGIPWQNQSYHKMLDRWEERKPFLVLGEAAQGSLYQIISSNKLPLGYIYWLMLCFLLRLSFFIVGVSFLHLRKLNDGRDSKWPALSYHRSPRPLIISSGLFPHFNMFLILKSFIHVFSFWKWKMTSIESSELQLFSIACFYSQHNFRVRFLSCTISGVTPSFHNSQIMWYYEFF